MRDDIIDICKYLRTFNTLLFINYFISVSGLLHLLDTFFSDYREKDDGTEKKSEDQVIVFVEKIEPIFIFCLIW